MSMSRAERTATGRPSSMPRLGAWPQAGGCQLREHAPDEAAPVQRYIQQRYAAAYGARLEHFMPRLFSLRAPDGGMLGAFGIRTGEQHFFLERYLDESVERAIGRRLGAHVARRRIVEIGQFAGWGPGAMRAMIAMLTARLHGEGVEWVVFTGTRALRNAFQRLGLQPCVLTRAEADRLDPMERPAWGRYYAHAPLVLFGNVAEGFLALAGAERAQ